MQSSIYPLLDEVLARIRPTASERERLREVARAIISRIDRQIQSNGVACQPMLVGSAARDTWLSGDHDLDIFLGVPEDSDLSIALQLARGIWPIHQEKYAEHAYIHAEIDGFDVDLVPCYLLEDSSKIKSAVDRTPFHTKYICQRIRGLEDEVLLLKQFLKGIEVYGSELKVGGFSGYLAELLIIFYGSFISVLQEASHWRPGQLIDLENHCRVSHEDPLVVVDPVDPRRNVAAALTLDRMMQLSAAARCFLRDPALEFFFPEEPEPISDQDLLCCIEIRGSTLILIDFEAPPFVEDVIFPQLRKAQESIEALLERKGFSLLRGDVDCHHVMGISRARMLFELETAHLPAVVRRAGPPVWEEEHLERFLTAHPNILSGPYIEDGRAFVEICRKHTTAKDLLEEELCGLSLGKHLTVEVKKGYNIYEGPELAEIRDHGFRVFMGRYLAARQRIC